MARHHYDLTDAEWNPPVPELLKKFYDKTDRGRHGANATSL